MRARRLFAPITGFPLRSNKAFKGAILSGIDLRRLLQPIDNAARRSRLKRGNGRLEHACRVKNYEKLNKKIFNTNCCHTTIGKIEDNMLFSYLKKVSRKFS